MTKKFIKSYSTLLALGLILLLGFFLRFYQLDVLPGDTFGDMVENIEHVQSVRRGDWKLIYGFDGREGLYFYIAALTSLVLGNSYFNLKCITATVGVLTIITSYYLAKEVTNKQVAILTAFLVSVSKWPLVFSRLGFRTVFTPFLTSIVLFFFFRAMRTKKLSDMIACVFFLGVGLYIYTAFKFVVISIVLMTVVYFLLKRKISALQVKQLAISGVVLLLVALPQLYDMWRAPDLYYSHPGPMIFVDGKLPGDWYQKFARNVIGEAGMLHIRGDVVSRVNPKREPLIDPLSGVFFLIGVVGIALYHNNKRFLLLVVPFLILQLPSILVLNFPDDVPSSTRTTSIIPLVCLIIAIGIQTMVQTFKQKNVQGFFLVAVLSVVFWLNFMAYFVRYQAGLPNHNVAYDRVIAAYIDRLPIETSAYLVGSIWGEQGQPHPRAIRYSMKSKHQLTIHDQELTEPICSVLDLPSGKDFFIVMNPNFSHLLTEECFVGTFQKEIKTRFGDTVFIAISTQPID